LLQQIVKVQRAYPDSKIFQHCSYCESFKMGMLIREGDIYSPVNTLQSFSSKRKQSKNTSRANTTAKIIARLVKLH